MNYNFVPYESQGSHNKSFIGINKSFEITFSSKFCYENKVFSFSHAILFWDQENKAIGIHLTNNKKATGAYAIQRNSKGSTTRIAAKGFLSNNNIDPKKYASKYNWETFLEPQYGQLFVIKLDKK